jgi:glycerophosphoryl diester phosphodiesterase
MILDNAAGGEFIGIIESYTDWSFFFNDNSSVTLKKTLYSYDADSRKKGINHRGYNGSVPENTLPAFRMSRLKGFRYVETDVRFSSDGVPVLLHDENVTRTSNGRGAVADLSWNELRALDFGSNFRDYKNTKIPSLDEFLALCREIGLAPYLELKVGTEEQIGGIVRAVEEYGLADRTVYISFFDYLLRYVLTFNPSATVGLLVESPDYENAVSPALSLRTGANTVFIDSHDYGEGTVRLCRDAGLPLEIWTIDASSVIRSLSDYVSGVTSNNLHAGRVLSGKE